MNNPEIDWENLYHKIYSKLVAYFQVRLNAIEQAEDLAAVTFSKAWRSRAQYDAARGTPEAWIFAIARNVLIDELRRARPGTITFEQVSTGGSPLEQEIEQREAFALLRKLLGRLPQRESRILNLRYSEQMSAREIGQSMGLSQANVLKIMARTLTKLRGYWQIGELM